MQNRIRLRVAQTLRYFRHGVPVHSRWNAMLTSEAAARFAALSAGDQRHAIAIAAWLDDHGASSDLVTAGLLHDIGKAVPGVRIHLSDRIIKVLLARTSRRALAAIAAWPQARWPLGGLWVLSRHAAVGGAMVRDWGYPERVAWLVEHHEDQMVTDPDLMLLVGVDDGRPIPLGSLRVAHG